MRKHYEENGAKYDASTGMRLTNCCASFSTYVDGTLCCKSCYMEVKTGEGDGNEYHERKPTNRRYQVRLRKR